MRVARVASAVARTDTFIPPARPPRPVRVIHRSAAIDPEDEEPSAPREHVLATDVDVADSFRSQARGLMFRRSVPDDYALVFPFEEADSRSLHMLFVPFAIDALWLVDGEVTKAKRLRPWVGLGWGTADTIIELPAGAAEDVEPGDIVEVVE
ncbi:DUF192 domain-containing protein [Halobacterium noricense]